MKRFSCGICGFPKVLPEAPTPRFGELALIGGVTEETLKLHFLKHHSKQYRNLLQEFKEVRDGD